MKILNFGSLNLDYDYQIDHFVQPEECARYTMEWEKKLCERMNASSFEAMIVCENGKLRLGEIESSLGMKESEYRKCATDFYKHIDASWTESIPENENAPYEKILQGFCDECLGRGKSIADGREGRKSLLLSNAMYLSSWESRMVTLPKAGSEEELAFEKKFESWLEKKISESK